LFLFWHNVVYVDCRCRVLHLSSLPCLQLR
jgi:hypothetical protein